MKLFGLNPDEFRKLLLSVGSHIKQRALTPVEVASLFSRMIANGATVQDCASAVHFDGPSMVHRFLKLLTLSVDIQHNVDWGSSGAVVGFSAAAELARLEPNDQITLARAAMEHVMTTAEVREVVQLRKRSARTIQECVNEVIATRPQTVRRHVFVGAIASEQLRRELATMLQRDRDLLIERHLRKFLPREDNLGAKLGVSQFTIVTQDQGAAVLGRMTPDFETALNAMLEAEHGR